MEKLKLKAQCNSRNKVGNSKLLKRKFNWSEVLMHALAQIIKIGSVFRGFLTKKNEHDFVQIFEGN